MRLLREHAKEIIKAPTNWALLEIEVLPGAGETIYRVRGAECELYKRGERKGKPNLRKRIPGTDQNIYISKDKHEKWLEDWEKKAAKCSECEGKGVVVVGWNKKTGTRYGKCKKCGGNGVPTWTSFHVRGG